MNEVKPIKFILYTCSFKFILISTTSSFFCFSRMFCFLDLFFLKNTYHLTVILTQIQILSLQVTYIISNTFNTKTLTQVIIVRYLAFISVYFDKKSLLSFVVKIVGNYSFCLFTLIGLTLYPFKKLEFIWIFPLDISFTYIVHWI